MVASSASSIRSIRRKPYFDFLMVSYFGVSLGPREKALPATPIKQLIDPVIDDEQKTQSPTQVRLNELGMGFAGFPDVERSLAALTSQHINLSHVMNNLEALVKQNSSSDSFARVELEKKLEQVKRERSAVEKQKMEVGILITRVRRKLDLIDGRGDGDSFIWSKKWGSEGME